jgi:hypothetical protein
MQPYLPASHAVMMKFAARLPGGPRCPNCGERFQLSFSGGSLSEQRCACGVWRRLGADGIDPLATVDEAAPTAHPY